MPTTRATVAARRIRGGAQRQQGRGRETMRAAADGLAGQLGFAALPGGGGRRLPVVRGEWLGAEGAPTIFVYGHYDVQPAGDLAEWITPPFELTVDGDIARGRGATDERAPSTSC